MEGKSFMSGLFILLFLGALGGGATFIGLGASGSEPSTKAPIIVIGSSLGTAALVMLLNYLGLRLGKKSIGVAGMLISVALVAVGFYFIFGKLLDNFFGSMQNQAIVAGTLLTSGVVGLISSLGVTIAA